MKRLIVLVLAIAALGMVHATPAQAHHGLVHWDRPPIVISDGKFDANVQDAAYFWQDRGFPGYYPPLPQKPTPAGSYCANNYTGYITVCTVSRSIVQTYCGVPCDGYSWAYIKPNTTNIINGSYILVADDLTPYRRQQIWRHEMGHALGMGHTNTNTCVMRIDANVPLGDGCPEDIWHLDAMYPATW